MADVEINDLASLGVILDVPAYMLPPEALSYGHNIRFNSQGVEALAGQEQIFGSLLHAPHFIFPVVTNSGNFWFYFSLAKAGVYDGVSHTDVTNIGGDYAANETRDWNAAMLSGIPIFNNGADIPQYWPSYSVASPLENLPNWPSDARTRILRSFGPYLMAFNLTIDGVNYPHLAKWSHAANPGEVPSSWDVDDPALDAGEKDLTDTQQGGIVEARALGNAMFVYKENSTKRVIRVGGRFIFDFQDFLDETGCLGPRCVTTTGDGLRHVVATQDDLIIHNGNNVESILTQRQKTTIFNEIDGDHYPNSFLFTNPSKSEVWFCYPTDGSENPNKAVIWNYRNGQKGVLSSADVNFRNAVTGPIESSDTATWEDGDETWEQETGQWSQVSNRKTVLAATDLSKILQKDVGLFRDGATITSTMRREGLAILGRKRDGSPIVDHKVRKLCKRIWPKVQGGPVNIRVGRQELVNGPTTWSDPQVFDPETQIAVDPMAEGRAIGVEFSASSKDWRVDGYKLEIERLGDF